MIKEMFKSWLALWGYDKSSFFMFGIMLIIAIMFVGVFIFELLRLIFF